MIAPILSRRALVAICLAGMGFGVPCSAHAQTMSFSVYTDMQLQEDSPTVVGSASAADYSTGCVHQGYFTNLELDSPDGRSAIIDTSGLDGMTSLDFGDATGDWTVIDRGRYQCSCMYYSTVSFGGGLSLHFGSGLFAYRLDYVINGSLANYHRCNAGPQCVEMTVALSKITPAQTTFPLYVYMKVIWIGGQNLCGGFDIGAASTCAADIYIGT